MTRRVIIGVVLAFTAFFAFLTFHDVVENGVSFLSIVSFAVLALFTIALLGMFSQPPE
jgi:hypothetical protein